VTLQKLSCERSRRSTATFIVATIIRKEKDMSAHAIDMPVIAQDNRWRRGFWSVWATQFQESFSDNAYRWIVISFVANMAMHAGSTREYLNTVAGILFAAPFVLFSPAGGYLADRYSKRSVILGSKFAEIVVMGIALVGLTLGNLRIMLVALFLRGIQSSCYSPSKFGMLPEILPEEKLSWGNGVIELGSFAAIICGTVAGTSLYSRFSGQLRQAGFILFAATLMGVAISSTLPRVRAAGSTERLHINPFAQLLSEWKLIRSDRTLFLAVLGNTYFFMLAALLQYAVEYYGQDVLRISAGETGYLQAAIAVGIGLGSFTAGYLSGGKIEYGLIPFGAAGMTALSVSLSRGGVSFASVATQLALLGFAGGFFAVPVMAIIQHRPDATRKGGIIAASNQLSFVGIGMASLLWGVLTSLLHISVTGVFLFGGLMTTVATIYAVWLMPDSVLRLLAWVLVHSVYRMRIQGRENIPSKGGALFVCNHLSLVDALLLSGSTERHIRFLMFKRYYDHPIMGLFGRAARAIPISSEQRPREMIRSLRTASESIREGEVVCIFAEGQMTRLGQLLPFRHGFERIMKNVDAPIIPVHLDGVWGSIFSFERGRYIWKLPKRALYPITVSYGKPLPPTSTAVEVRQAVQELQTEAYKQHGNSLKPLPYAIIKTARRHPFRFAMADAEKRVRFGSALARAVFLARRLKRHWADQEMVGILLPPSPGGALVNVAATLAGKIPVNLNYTLSNEGIASCARQCSIQTVVTSKKFLERVKIEVPGKAILLEDEAANPTLGERLRALLMAWFAPASMLVRRKVHPDDLATVIFSSGSTGDPKGVLLTHANIVSNVAQLEQCFGFEKHDRILGILPFFHSFGFTGTLMLPLTLGVGVVFHPNPFDARTIGALVSEHAVTFLLATPTFLQGYIRRCDSGQFGSLRVALVGAEKLQERTAQAFEDKFGIRPLEAYGCTECAPAVTVNTRDYRAPGTRQVGSKRGTIGHALSGVSIRIVDPDTFQPVVGPGLMLVRGPNVMRGYLGRPEETAKVLRDGWYVTGDIATMDEDGFVEIIDRLSRFSKIGGEMVPHIKVEEKLHELIGAQGQVFVVTSGPDEKKGERLLVLHTLDDEQLQSCLAHLDQIGLPNLWIPRRDAFFKVDAIPYLGTGKLDLRKVRELALQLAAHSRASSAV
jgi:acyl-[acyl-carrier-protein]-phospholipid O-acyltransferase/long-chain-fatty-acid--[acyl-carrier-protein] ligase